MADMIHLSRKQVEFLLDLLSEEKDKVEEILEASSNQERRGALLATEMIEEIVRAFQALAIHYKIDMGQYSFDQSINEIEVEQ